MQSPMSYHVAAMKLGIKNKIQLSVCNSCVVKMLSAGPAAGGKLIEVVGFSWSVCYSSSQLNSISINSSCSSALGFSPTNDIRNLCALSYFDKK